MRERLTDHPEFMKTAAGLRREIPDDYKYNPKKLKHLKHILHNVTVSVGTLTSCLNEMAKIKGPDVSPDGFLGGVGYMMPIKDIKQKINNAVHDLGNVADSIADELTNPRWNIKDKEVDKLIKEKENMDDKVDDAQEEGIVEEEEVNPDDLITAEEFLNPEIEAVLKTAVSKNLVKSINVNKGVKKC